MTSTRKTKKSQFGLVNEHNVDEYLEWLISQTSGDYIIQSVAFNKTNEHQLKLLRAVLLEPSTFSGLIKHMLANRYEHIPLRMPPGDGEELATDSDRPASKFAKSGTLGRWT